MNNSVKALLLAAAGTGLMTGTAAAQSISPAGASTVTVARTGQPAGQAGLATGNWGGDTRTTLSQAHSCKNKNACKGQGGCNTSDMGCKGKNTCKGKGGCAVS